MSCHQTFNFLAFTPFESIQIYTFALYNGSIYCIFFMKTLINVTLSIFFTLNLLAQDKQPYQLYNAEGKKTSYKKMLKEAQKADIVLFGELHNNAISHWLQYELTADLEEKEDLILGFEMLERNQDELMDQYMKGKIDQKQLDSLTKLWNNYKTDYKPLVDFAKSKKIEVCSCNIPRYLANKVFKNGFEGLEDASSQEKEWMAPLPIPPSSNSQPTGKPTPSKATTPPPHPPIKSAKRSTSATTPPTPTPPRSTNSPNAGSCPSS